MTGSGAGPSGKPPVRYHGRVIRLLLLTFVLPAILVSYLMQPRLSIWTFVPGVLGGALVLGWMYFKWWRESRLS